MRALGREPVLPAVLRRGVLPHQLPFDRSSLTRWRQRMGEDKLVALIQESLAVATRMGAAKPADFRQVVIDTTVQEKAVAFPTDAKLMHRARERLVRLAQARGVTLRQSYVRVGKIALIRHQRYAHAKQFKRANRALRSIRTMLGRVIRDITRKIVGRPELADVFALPLSRARRVKDQRQRQRGRKLLQQVADPQKGLALALKDCAPCHGVAKGETRSPNPNAPSFQKITDVPGMTAIALNVALQSPHKTMPNLMFEPDELRDLVAYILSMKTRE